MLILLTNDDGINAPGLLSLQDALSELGKLCVVAPATEQSGVGHACTLRKPLRVQKITQKNGSVQYAVHGTPVDAVKIAMRSVLSEPPDLVVSGINQGENAGVDLLYSGTVAAAREAAFYGVPAIAVSLCSKDSPDFSVAANFARELCEKVIVIGLPKGTVINANIPPVPAADIRGVAVTHQADSRYEEVLEQKAEPDGTVCKWTRFEKVLINDSIGSDMTAIRNGYISVTPIHHRLTHYKMINEIAGWKLDGLIRRSL